MLGTNGWLVLEGGGMSQEVAPFFKQVKQHTSGPREKTGRMVTDMKDVEGECKLNYITGGYAMTV